MSLLENLNVHCDNETSQPLVIHICNQTNTVHTSAYFLKTPRDTILSSIPHSPHKWSHPSHFLTEKNSSVCHSQDKYTDNTASYVGGGKG